MNAAAERPWQEWVERWERQQERYLVDREERFSLMLDFAEAHLGIGLSRCLDLCCGNGALTRRLLDRFPEACVTALDWDPVHLEIARRTLPARAEVVEADVSRSGWSAAVETGARSVELAVTATALHWLEPADLIDLYAELAGLIVPDGLFLNADHLPPAEPTIRRLGEELTHSWQQANFADGAEDHAGFHAAALADPVLRAAAALRTDRFGEPHGGLHQDVGFHRASLLEAGFREVAEVWRHRDDAVLLAVR